MTASHQHPDTLPNALAWADRAACRGLPLDLFFSDAKGTIRQAKRVCRPCPVRPQCLTETLRAEGSNRYGVSGGLDADERAELAGQNGKGQAAKPSRRDPAPCGTPAAYRRHFRRGEIPCAECSRANAERRARRKPAECGTNAGHRKHVREKTEICAPCRQAHSAAEARLRRTGSTTAPK